MLRFFALEKTEVTRFLFTALIAALHKWKREMSASANKLLCMTFFLHCNTMKLHFLEFFSVLWKCFNLIKNLHLCEMEMERAKLTLLGSTLFFGPQRFLSLENSKVSCFMKISFISVKAMKGAVHMVLGVWWQWSTTSFRDYTSWLFEKKEREENLISAKMPKFWWDLFPPANTTHKLSV